MSLHSHSLSPSLSVFKDGQFLESIPLHPHDFFVLGRHSNCDILLSHPSVSRHHLEIQVLPASRELLLTDLDSVHGTSINGTVLSPLKIVKAKEGDCIKLGASTRTYVVRWLHSSPTANLSKCQWENNDSLMTFVDPIKKGSTVESENECWNSHGHQEHRASNQQADNGIICTGTAMAGCDLDVNQTENSSSYLQKNDADITYHREASSAPPNAVQERNTVSASGLWLRRSKSKPPPPLLTSLPVSTGFEASSNNAVPFAPPPPLCYLDAVAPSAPPLPSDYQESPQIDDKIEEQVGSAGSSDGLIRHSELRLSMENSEETLEEHDSDKENGHAAIIKNHGLERNSLIDACAQSDKQESEVMKCRNHFYSVRPQDENEVNSSDIDSKGDIDILYTSDKENESPTHLTPNVDRHKGLVDTNKQASRIPFQSLPFSSKPPTPSLRRSASLEENSDAMSSPVTTVDKYMSRKFQGVLRIAEPRRLWHIVVDISCFLDSKSFDALKSLEGIREVRLIVPTIVISELESFKAASVGNSRIKALRWIESCMVNHPSWIHVQSSSEITTAVTPPVSPLFEDSRAGNFNVADLMSPTNSDHVLNYAVQLSTNISAGKIALLTNDTVLRIKAMAEERVLVSDSPVKFCESLLNPYSERFLWSGSIAHGYTFAEKTCQVKSTSGLAPQANAVKESVLNTVKVITASKHYIGEGLKRQCHKQAQGLKHVIT